MFIQLKKLLTKRISRLGNKEKIELGDIDRRWPSIIDSLLEEKENPVMLVELKFSRPIRLQNAILTIEVKNQAIASELSLIGFELMEKVNQSLGRRAVKRLFFRVKRV